MAIFHFSAQVISRSDGCNAVDAAAYRAGLRMACERTGQVFNHTYKKEVAYRAIVGPSLPDGLPPWVLDRAQLWNRVEAIEKRCNSQLAREVEISLPIELTQEQHIALVHRFVQEQFVSLGMLADFALHAKPGNPHVHILLTLRDVGPEGFGGKRRDWNNPALVQQWREAWADTCNAALAEAGHAERIDHRSNEARGIDAAPTVHLGRRTPFNGEAWDARADFNAWVQTSVALAKVRAEVQRVQSQIIDLTTTLAQALADRERPASKAAPVPSTPSRIWMPGSAMPARDFSVAGLLARRAAGPVAPASPLHRSTPSSQVLHPLDEISQGEKPC